MGVTTLDVVRASTFIAEINGIHPQCVDIPVIGGHSGVTIIPVLSQCDPPLKLTEQSQIAALTKRIQGAGTEVVKAKAGGGSATLSMAYAGARLMDAILKGLSNCVYDPNRVLGVTTLDVVRASTFIGEINCTDPECVDIPVIGGHSGVTIIPVLSQCEPKVRLTEQSKIEALTKRIQGAGTEVVKAKAGGGSATLSMAYAGARLMDAILKGLGGRKTVECAYVASTVTEASYFSNRLLFGPNGVKRNLGYGKLNAYEQSLLKKCIPELKKNIEAGLKFMKK